MASYNAGARACEVPQADEDLAYEVGPVHDYFWHRRHRARRGGQLVDVAILAGLAGVVSCWALILITERRPLKKLKAAKPGVWGFGGDWAA